MHRFALGDRGQYAETPLVQRIMLAGLVSLALAIGLTTGAIAWRTATFDRTVPDLSTADPAVGYAFYAGIDQVLDGGSPDDLEQVVSHDFVDHLGNGSEDRSADEMVEELTAFGAAFPGTHVDVIDIQASSSSLVVSIAPVGARPVVVAGMTFSTQAAPGGYEVLRIRHGKVSERWTAGVPAVRASTYEEASFNRWRSPGVATRLDRVALPVDGWVAGYPGESVLLVLESGSVHLEVNFVDADENKQSVTSSLESGRVVQIVPGARIRVENVSDAPANVLLYSTNRVTPVEAPPLTFRGGAAATLLWSSFLPPTVGGSWRFSIGRLDLPAALSAELAAPEDTLVILYSAGGSLQALTSGGTVETLDTEFVAIDQGNAGTIAPGVAANISNATHVSLRSDPTVPIVVWVISIIPDREPESPSN